MKSTWEAIAAFWTLAGTARAGVIRGAWWKFVQALCGSAVYISAVWLVLRKVADEETGPAAASGVTIIVVVSLACQCGAAYLGSRYSWTASYEVSANVRLGVLDHLMRVPVLGGPRRRRGEIESLLSGELRQCENFLSEGLPKLAQSLGLPVLVTVAALLVQPLLGFAFLVGYTFALPLAAWAGSRTAHAAEARMQVQAQAASRYLDVLKGMRVWRIFAGRKRVAADLDDSAEKLRRASISMVHRLVPPMMCASAGALIGIPLVIALSERSEQHVAITFLLLSYAAFKPLLDALAVGEQWQVARAVLGRIRAIVATSELPDGSLPAPPSSANVSMRGVGYSYSQGASVDNIDLDIPARGMVALLGTSGSGKSTVAGLLCRLDDRHRGTITIGGTDICDLDPEALTATVTLVAQDTHLLRGTVAENIALGAPEASRAEIEAAARHAHIDEEIRALPAGFDTTLGEDGAGLSGGQRQRIALARAFCVGAPILVLDEPTAGLDPLAEEEVAAAIADVAASRSVLIITHRASTIMTADDILVLDRGVIAARGPLR